jgi:hypothetical protein
VNIVNEREFKLIAKEFAVELRQRYVQGSLKFDVAEFYLVGMKA